MKKIIALSLLLLGTNMFAQEITPVKMFSAFKVSALAGVNFSSLSGGSVILEGKINLTSSLNLTLSVGYSKINKKAGYNVNTYRHINFLWQGLYETNYYETESYYVHEINYDVFPVSLGFEYYFLHNVFSPYTLFEVGYNGVESHQVRSGGNIGVGGQYNSFDQLPSAYKSIAPAFTHKNPYRIAVGVGTNYQLTPFVSLDLRYLFQYNHSIENSNQILVGIVF